MDIYYEYNLINNIPIIHPELNIDLNFLPRQELVTPDIVLNIYNKNNNIIKIYNKDFKYIKVNINKIYKTLNYDIEYLHCYILHDYDLIYNENIDYIDNNNNNNKNINFIVTYPVLKYKNKLYTINLINNDISILYLNNNMKINYINDKQLINNLINNNLYTICDTNILIMSLYRKNKITKNYFKKYLLNINKINYYYIDDIWKRLFHNIKNVYLIDYPYLYISKDPSLIDYDIEKLLTNYNLMNIYTQYNYNNKLLFTSSLSYSYPNTNISFIKNNIYMIDTNMWINNIYYNNKYINDKKALYIPDYYELYTSIISVPSFWKYWIKNKRLILKGILYNLKNNKLLFLTESLTMLFQLYNKGHEYKKIKKNRVRELWLNLLHIVDYNHNIINKIIEMYILNNKKIKEMPYIFLLDIYDYLDLSKKKPYILNYSQNTCIYKNTTLYDILKQSDIDTTLYNFYKNIIYNRYIYIMTYIYKKFNMFYNKNDNIQDNRYHIVGECLINYLENKNII